MAKFTLNPDTKICYYPAYTTLEASIFRISIKSQYLNGLRINPSLKKFKVSCSIQEKETANAEEKRRILKGLKVNDELEEKVGLLEAEIEGKEVGFVWNSPWKNLPQRYKLIGTTSLAFIICNMDKVNLSIAIIPMSHEFGWNSSVAGLVQSSFFWGYALSQLPGGWLSKIFGGRLVVYLYDIR